MEQMLWRFAATYQRGNQGKETTLTTPAFEQLQEFLEVRPISLRAAGPLKNGTVFQMLITGEESTPYHVIREKKQTFLRDSPPPKDPEITFTISPKAVGALAGFQSANIGEFGVKFFSLMVSDDPDVTLKVDLHVGVIGLTRMGVFKILLLGGPDVMSFLARKGFGSMSKIMGAVKDMVKKK